MNLKDIMLLLFTFVVPLIALTFIVRNYLRKSGIYIRGQFCVSSSVWAEEKYINSLTIENIKDRPVIIFKIFVLVGRNYYIELNDFDHEPMILKPYESYTCHYDPVDFYSVSMYRVKMSKMLDFRKVPARIVLATSSGRYVVREYIRRWDPITDFFKNHMTAIVRPMRPNEKQGFYGADVKYLVKITTEDGYIRTMPIYYDDYNHLKFNSFRLTEESLLSKESLEDFLTTQALKGNLKCVNVDVFDAKKLRKENYGGGYDEAFEAEYISWFQYHILGRIMTKCSDIKLYFSNRKNRKV